VPYPDVRRVFSKVGACHKFAPNLLRSLLRVEGKSANNPNILLVGEVRDGETAKAALYAAETGHLVLATLHADKVLEIPSRLLNLLPPEDKAHGRYLLSKVAKAFISQRLLRLRDGGRVAAREILLQVPAMPALIERAKEHEFAHLMRSHQSLGMIDLQSDLLRLRGRLEPGEYERHKEE
jgi:Tfp pilus assembly pilus retraction ATPase PilT